MELKYIISLALMLSFFAGFMIGISLYEKDPAGRRIGLSGAGLFLLMELMCIIRIFMYP